MPWQSAQPSTQTTRTPSSLRPVPGRRSDRPRPGDGAGGVGARSSVVVIAARPAEPGRACRPLSDVGVRGSSTAPPRPPPRAGCPRRRRRRPSRRRRRRAPGCSASSTSRAASRTIRSAGITGPSSDLAGPRRAHHPPQRQHVRPRHLADEVAHVVVGGCADHLGGRADLHDLAVAHDQDPVAELERLLQVVRDEDHRLADLFVQPDDLVLHVPADQRVERGERLVEHHHLRVGGQRPGQPDALLHAAGELVGVGVLVAGQPDQVDHLLGPGPALRLVLAAHLQAVGDVVDHLAVRQQTEVLEHHRHVVPAQLAQLDVVGAGDLLTVHHAHARRSAR